MDGRTGNLFNGFYMQKLQHAFFLLLRFIYSKIIAGTVGIRITRPIVEWSCIQANGLNRRLIVRFSDAQ